MIILAARRVDEKYRVCGRSVVHACIEVNRRHCHISEYGRRGQACCKEVGNREVVATDVPEERQGAAQSCSSRGETKRWLVRYRLRKPKRENEGENAMHTVRNLHRGGQMFDVRLM